MKGVGGIPQLPKRRVRSPWSPMALLSEDQIEAVHEASMHILENFGIEMMSASACDLFAGRGAAVDRDTMTVRVDRGMVGEALETAPPVHTLTPRNPENALTLGGDHINFTLVAGPPNVHDFERGRRAGNYDDYCDFTRLAQHYCRTNVSMSRRSAVEGRLMAST